MAEIFAAPEEIKVPLIDFMNYNRDEHLKAEEAYREEVRKLLKKEGYKGKNFGEIIRIPHADSHAEYMVVSWQPLQLMHMPLGDAWDSQFADLMTPEKVQEMIDSDKRMQELFSKKDS